MNLYGKSKKNIVTEKLTQTITREHNGLDGITYNEKKMKTKRQRKVAEKK